MGRGTRCRKPASLNTTVLRDVLSCLMPSLIPGLRETPEPPLRRFLLAVFLLGAVGTSGELLLVEHFEDPWQYTPLVLIGASLLVLAVHGAARRRATLHVFRVLMVLFVPAGAAGLMLHYRANIEFVAETYPDLMGWPLFWDAVRGTAPPSLAPGAMIALALAGLGYAHRHRDLTPTTTTTGASS
jgi:hypothetical protein